MKFSLNIYISAFTILFTSELSRQNCNLFKMEEINFQFEVPKLNVGADCKLIDLILKQMNRNILVYDLIMCDRRINLSSLYKSH